MQGFDMAIDDATATDFYNRIDTTEGMERDILATQLENWASRKIGEGQITTEKEHDLIYTDLDAWWDERGGDQVEQDVKFGAANRKFIADQFGQTASEQADYYESYRDQWFSQAFGKKPTSESEAYKMIGGSIQSRKQAEQAYDLIAGDVALSLFDQVNKGTPVDIPTLMTKWKEENAEILDALPDNWEANTLKAAEQYYVENEQMLRDHGDVLQRLYANIINVTGRKVEGAPEDDVKTVEDLNAIIDGLGELPKEVRDRGYAAIFMAAKRQGMDDKGFWEMAAEAWPRSLNMVRTTALVAQETDAEAKVALLQGEGPLFRNKNTGQLTRATGTAFSPQDFEEVSTDDRATLLQQAERELQRFNVVRELRDLADNRFDPIKSNATGPLKFAQDIALLGPQSLAFTGVAAIPVVGPVLTGAAIYADEYNQLRLEGFTPSQSRTLAAVSAPLQTAAEVFGAKLVFGRYKWYRETIQKLVNPARFARTTQGAVSFFGKVVGESITEGTQDLTTPLVKDVAAALSDEFPDVNWEETLTQWKDSRLEVLAATLMPVIGGHMVETFADGERFASAERRQKMMYDPTGINEQERRYIEDGTTPEERRNRYVETLKQMPPERVQAAKDRIAEQSRAAATNQEDAAMPTMETQKDTAGRMTYIVRDEKGVERYRTTSQEAAEDAYRMAVMKSTAAQFSADRIATKELIDWWTQQDPNNVVRLEGSRTAQQELERLQGLGDTAGIETLHRRIAQDPRTAGQDYSTLTILGTASIETVAEGVFRGVIALNESSRPKDALEEINHVFVRRAVAQGSVNEQQLRDWLTATEAITGETYAKDNFDDIIESLAIVAEAYVSQRIDQNAESQLPASFVDYLKRLVQVLKEVMARGLALRKGFADGTLGQDYEQFLAESVGLADQTIVDRSREKTAQEVAPDGRGADGLTDDERFALEQELQAEMERDAAEAAGEGGIDILDAVREAGGLPAKTSSKVYQYSGELQRIREASKGGNAIGVKGVFNLFRKNAPDLDALIKDLQTMGFNQITTPSDLFDMVERRILTGRPIYGYEAAATARAVENYSISLVGQYVKAKRAIEDSPLADEDASVKRGAIGYVDDYDSVENLLYVDFGNGAIAVDPAEVSVAARQNYSIAITPQQDADYLAAVERGDMETAQRMVDEAARRAGFDIGPVWHGGADGFDVFDWRFIGAQGNTEGKGFYFSNDRDLAAGYAERHGGRLLRVYLRSGKPIDGKKQTISEATWRRILRIVHQRSEQSDDYNSPLWNYADISVDGLTSAIEETARILTESSESDVDTIAGFVNGGADPEITYDAIYEITGKTGIVESEAWGRAGHEVYVATSANHVKLADPVTYDSQGNVIPLSQRFDATTPNINYSIASSDNPLVQQAEAEAEKNVEELSGKQRERQARVAIRANYVGEDGLFDLKRAQDYYREQQAIVREQQATAPVGEWYADKEVAYAAYKSVRQIQRDLDEYRNYTNETGKTDLYLTEQPDPVITQDVLDERKGRLPKHKAEVQPRMEALTGKLSEDTFLVSIENGKGKQAGRATVRISPDYENTLYVNETEVYVEFRNKGFGEALYREIAKFAQSRGLTEIRSDQVSPAAARVRFKLFSEKEAPDYFPYDYRDKTRDATTGPPMISMVDLAASYSISTQSEIDRVGAALNRLDRDPLERVKIYEKAQEKFLRVMADNREMLAGMQDGDLAQMRRTQILQALGELDGIISVLPPEVRSKIGGYTQLAKVDPMDVFKGDQKVSEVRGMSGAIISAWMREGLNIGEAQKKTELPAGYRAERNLDPTRADRAIADVFIQRINRINEALEKFLRDEYNTAAVELFKRAKPQRSGAGEKPKGKLGADVHDLFDKLKEATEWSAEEAQAWADGQWARIESGELNPYEETHAMMAAQMVPLFADWANADSSQRAAAVTMGKDVLNRAYKGEQQRIIAQRTKRGYDRTDLSKDAGVSAEDDKARQDALKRENSLPSKWESAMLNLLNFDQVLRYVFGNDSKIARQISDRQRKADNAKSDDIAALSDEWAAFLSELGGGEMQGQQLLFELSRMDEEIDGVSYSQNQLIAISMMWMQPKGRQHMEGFLDSDGQPAGKWHYNQDFVNKAEKLLRGEAKAIRQYLLDKYDAEYEAINKVYRKVYGLNLPKNQFYSPLVVESIRAPAQAGIDPVTGGVFAAGANSPSALRSRGGAIAQPVFRDAVQTYFGHMLQMAHWKAYAEFNGEVSALLGHRDTRNVVKGKAGEQAATVMNNWLQYFQQGGNKDAANHLAINQMINRMTGNFATMALFGRISTLALQVTQLGAASAKMPVGAYLSRFGKLMSGRLGWKTALDSAYIQRRIKDMPPAVALAMQGLRSEKPNAIREAARRIGSLISGFDGFFTAGTYAIVYDYQMTQARRNGMGGQEAADYAREATERIVDEIAQPTRAGARSIFEINSTNPVARAVWAFSSEARKNLGLGLYAGAKGSGKDLGKAVFYVLVLNGLVGTIIRNAFRDLRDDDDEETFDEKNWGWNRMAAMLISDPLYGFPVVGEAVESAIFNAFGVYTPTGPLFDVAPAVPAVKRLAYDYPMGEQEAEFRDIVRDVNRILSTAGLFNNTIAGAAAISNLVKDTVEVGDNVLNRDE
jgi:GNAT superfamily N-acetyltransferase